jgi:hypothetical protein
VKVPMTALAIARIRTALALACPSHTQGDEAMSMLNEYLDRPRRPGGLRST